MAATILVLHGLDELTIYPLKINVSQDISHQVMSDKLVDIGSQLLIMVNQGLLWLIIAVLG